jgi:hypothetical protein
MEEKYLIWKLLPLESYRIDPNIYEDDEIINRANERGLKLSDAEIEVSFVQQQLDPENPNIGKTVECSEDEATDVYITYVWIV